MAMSSPSYFINPSLTFSSKQKKRGGKTMMKTNGTTPVKYDCKTCDYNGKLKIKYKRNKQIVFCPNCGDIKGNNK